MSEFTARLDDLNDEFELFDDWEERYKYIIDLGKDMAPLTLSEKTETNKVRGCASQVWLVIDDAPDGILRFRGDSDAFIVKGLIALLSRLLNGLSHEAIQGFSIRDTLNKLGLNEALSSQRTNGLMSMVERLKHATA
ncbi:SufE family protein [Asticcacaulis endophyticus]|uniref:Cysteine desufuration protein SufE n=1 Tax=Asticcacaulis endophyticus TaxID=1395890 RepID=A0A918PSC8_9CAUL|nr:SufE family protein [Asticcacaulis endophyticus]GGZ20348.1 cysteine desufuration protein SufE [Asticcacaulis endophyticus]